MATNFAEMPLLSWYTRRRSANQVLNLVRVFSRIVPTIPVVWCLHSLHSYSGNVRVVIMEQAPGLQFGH